MNSPRLESDQSQPLTINDHTIVALDAIEFEPSPLVLARALDCWPSFPPLIMSSYIGTPDITFDTKLPTDAAHACQHLRDGRTAWSAVSHRCKIKFGRCIAYVGVSGDSVAAGMGVGRSRK